jgi:hypothetical protein
MQINPTIPMAATFNGERIIIDLQEGLQLSLSIHEAMRLSRTVTGEAVSAMEAARLTDTSGCEVIAFPAAKVRKAIVAARKAAKA